MKKIALKTTFILLTVSILICFVHTNDVLAQNGEGLTPGFWKHPQHFDMWVQYSPDMPFYDVFGVGDQIESTLGMTLHEALKKGGGGMYALNRHAVAALLNAIHPEINYMFMEAQVIEMVQDAYATGDFEVIKMILEYQNEMGSSLD